MADPARVFVIDDHPLMREGIVATIDRCDGVEVCGQAGCLKMGREGIDRERPDLVVTDLRFEKGDALAFIRELGSRTGSLPVVVVSMMDELVFAMRCIEAGALGYVRKEAPPGCLLKAIGEALAGNVWVSRAVSNARFGKNGKGRGKDKEGVLLHSLSDRELQVFRMIGEGAGRREIAEAMGVAETTVDSHKEHIKDKLAIASASDLATKASLWVQGHM